MSCQQVELRALSFGEVRVQPDLGLDREPAARELEVELVEERLVVALRLGRRSRREHQSNEHRTDDEVISISDHGQRSSFADSQY